MNYAQGAAALGILAVLFGGDVLTLFQGEQVHTPLCLTHAAVLAIMGGLLHSGCAVQFQLQCAEAVHNQLSEHKIC